MKMVDTPAWVTKRVDASVNETSYLPRTIAIFTSKSDIKQIRVNKNKVTSRNMPNKNPTLEWTIVNTVLC